eukprot:g12373.t1
MKGQVYRNSKSGRYYVSLGFRQCAALGLLLTKLSVDDGEAAFLGLPLVVLLAWLNVEDRWWSSSVPVDWPLVLGSAGCDIIYNTALAWGLAVTSPVFIAVGVNVNMLVDALLHGFWPSIAQYCGTLLIAVSFVILVLGPADRPVPEAEQSLTLART